jgi:hypothetical protein
MRHFGASRLTPNHLGLQYSDQQRPFENGIEDHTKPPVDRFDCFQNSHSSVVDQWLDNQAISKLVPSEVLAGPLEYGHKASTPDKVGKMTFIEITSFPLSHHLIQRGWSASLS